MKVVLGSDFVVPKLLKMGLVAGVSTPHHDPSRNLRVEAGLAGGGREPIYMYRLIVYHYYIYLYR